LEGAKKFFKGLFKTLPDVSDIVTPHIDVVEDCGDGFGQVFFVWKAPSSGYADATDTLIFDWNGQIFRQNFVVHYKKPIARNIDSVGYQ